MKFLTFLNLRAKGRNFFASFWIRQRTLEIAIDLKFLRWKHRTL